jgi:hypothetical protein
MKKRPSNVLLYVLLSILGLFGIYVIGGLVLDIQQGDPIEESQVKDSAGLTHSYDS